MRSSTYQPPGQVSELEGLGDVQVVVIGAGQAGLAVSHELSDLALATSSWSARELVRPGAISGTASAWSRRTGR